ncbi:MAG: hypothetical protein GQF41_2186 [Candidatus Rifleibacterium amylolyticum]|nr:MAG: hypothetical protein GQF41_2186 [Candidatus Rifleibacterium amylolyticum]
MCQCPSARFDIGITIRIGIVVVVGIGIETGFQPDRFYPQIT